MRARASSEGPGRRRYAYYRDRYEYPDSSGRLLLVVRMFWTTASDSELVQLSLSQRAPFEASLAQSNSPYAFYKSSKNISFSVLSFFDLRSFAVSSTSLSLSSPLSSLSLSSSSSPSSTSSQSSSLSCLVVLLVAA